MTRSPKSRIPGRQHDRQGSGRPIELQSTQRFAVLSLLISIWSAGFGSIVAHAKVPAIASTAADFYVSPDGSDMWSGTLTEPNAQQTDGPFATLQRARDAVRASDRKNTSDILVLIRGGTYYTKQTVVFGPQDSGKHGSITYAAYADEVPIFSAGQKLTGWQPLTTAPPGLPEKSRGQVKVTNVAGQFHALFDADGLLPRARSQGFVPLPGGSRREVRIPPACFRNWTNVNDMELVVRPHHAWVVNILPLKSVDRQRQTAQTSIDATYAMNALHFLKQTESCWVENALEELDQPGEWVLDSAAGKIYLWPRNTSPVLSPLLTEVIRVEGKIDSEGPADKPVRNLRFRGLTFMHGERYSIAASDAGLQHDWEMHDKASSLVRLRGAENCTIEKCRFAHSGSGAIRVDLHGQRNTISDNMIEHIGGTGILLCGYGPGTKDVNRKNVIYNNHIHHVGRIYSHSPGIMVWQSGENRVANNLVHHTPYTGIIISGCMTSFFSRRGRELGRTVRRHEVSDLPTQPDADDVRPYLHTRDNVFEYNEIHHAMELLGDGNGIYIRGAGPGNVIRRNYVHHLVAPMKMQAAIRTDGGQRDTLIAENLIYRCTSQGILLKLNNRCENNIIADIIAPPRGYYLAVREGPMSGATIKRNIFFSSSDECTFIDELPPGRGRTTEDRRGRKLAASHQADTDQNIYFCAANPELGHEMLKRQRHSGVDARSLAMDPLFVDAAKGDFRLKPDSPALQIGFVPFDISKAGLTTP